MASPDRVGGAFERFCPDFSAFSIAVPGYIPFPRPPEVLPEPAIESGDSTRIEKDFSDKEKH